MDKRRDAKMDAQPSDSFSSLEEELEEARRLCERIKQDEEEQLRILIKMMKGEQLSEEEMKKYNEFKWKLVGSFDQVVRRTITEFPKTDLLDELGGDPETIKLYEKAIKEGVETDRTVRVMIIGCFGQGKTTLVQRMKGEPIDNIDSTDGIVVHRCVSRAGDTLWTKDKELTKERVNERLASLAKAVSAKESCTSSKSSADMLDSEHEQSNEKDENYKKTGSSIRISRNQKLGDPSNTDIRMFKQALKRLKTSSEIEISTTKHICLWDFGGQYIYYATHQLFHSASAVYLLVFDLSLPLDAEVHDEDYPAKSNCKTLKDYIFFWMHSIHSFVGGSDGKTPTVILVGTHKDKLQSDEQAELYFERVRELFKFSLLRSHIYPKHFALSLTDDTNEQVDDLKSAILEVAERQNIQRAVPAKWVRLECELYEHAQKNIISFQDLQDIDQKMDYPLEDENQLKLFLKYHHAKGTYFYFDEEEMSRYVVVNPQFVIDAFRCIVKAKRFCQKNSQDLVPLWNELSDNAILKPDLFREVWKESSFEFSKYEDLLVLMMKKHRIISEVMKYEDMPPRLRSRDFYIVPSLLKMPDNGNIVAFLSGKNRSTVSIVYSFYFLGVVGTIFQRMLAAAIGTWPILNYGEILMVFDNGGVFKLDQCHAGLLTKENKNIELCVVNLLPDNKVYEGMGDFFRRFVEVVIQYEFSKLKRNDLEIQSSSSYEVKVRCQHTSHKNIGSRNTYPLKVIQEHTDEKICCPDHESHVLKKKDVQKDWFQQPRTCVEFPARRLSSKEYAKLACAIGYEWETLGLRLGVCPIKIQQACLDHHSTAMRIYEMLQQWDRECAEKATFDVLVRELQKLPDGSVNWEEVYNIKDNFYKFR